jgi:integral membrane protein (TIGR01906 family)
LRLALLIVSTPCAVVAVAVMLFLNPIWVGFDQDRSDAAALTGYTATQVHQVTGAILSDLVFGPPNFDVDVNGVPVLDERSRSHMADVRKVLLGLGEVALAAWILLLVLGVVGRGARWFWQGVRTGAVVLLAGVVVVGIGFAVFFDQAFELFHEIFFPPGTYMFDPRTEKLVQLFPDQFWSETSVAIAVVVLALAIAVFLGAGRLAGRAGSVATPDATSDASGAAL